MPAYVRFQTATLCPETGWPLGVFRASLLLRETDQYQVVLRDWIEEVYEWFNLNLPLPPSAELDRRAVFWFLPEAEQFIKQGWGMVAAYRDAGIPMTLERTTCPGRIVYRDSYQIGAIPYWPYCRGPPAVRLASLVLGVWRSKHATLRRSKTRFDSWRGRWQLMSEKKGRCLMGKSEFDDGGFFRDHEQAS